MILHIGATLETIENIDPHDTMNNTTLIKAINETAYDRKIVSKDTNHEARTDSKTTHAIILTAHAHQVRLALKIDVHVEVMNIHVLTHPYAKCHVLMWQFTTYTRRSKMYSIT